MLRSVVFALGLVLAVATLGFASDGVSKHDGGSSRGDCNNNGIEDDLEVGPLDGPVLLFDGVDDFVHLPTSETGALAELGQGDFTLEAWVWTNDTGRSVLIGNCDGTPYWNLEIHSSDPGGHIRLVFNDGTSSEDHRTSISVADGEWHHVAVVRTMGPGGRFAQTKDEANSELPSRLPC